LYAFLEYGLIIQYNYYVEITYEFWHEDGRLVIPFTLNFLYSYGESIGAETFLTVNDFITFVLQFVLGFGIAFQLPIIRCVLSLSGSTDSKFWQKNFRYTII
jgi:sec-independent protein translocase protein TatC